MTRTIAIALDAPALTRGVGFFETLWVLDRRPVFFRRHFRRLADSCRALEVPAPGEDRLRRAVRRALSPARAGEEYGMRWSYLALRPDLDDPRSWGLFATIFPVPADVLRKRRGVRAITLPADWQRLTPKWKTIDYRASVAGLRRARRRAAEEAIFVDARGHALEGTVCNLFALRGPRGTTPPESARILPGVVRAWVLENAPRARLRFREAPLPVEELRGGSFVTGSLTGLAPILTLDGRRCAPPPRELADLRGLYREDAATGRGDLEP